MTGHAANPKRACPSCKSSWIRRNKHKVYCCQACEHVFTSEQALVSQPKAKHSKAGSGQIAGPVSIGKQMANWPNKQRTAG